MIPSLRELHARCSGEGTPPSTHFSSSPASVSSSGSCRRQATSITPYHAGGPLHASYLRALGARVVLHGEDFDAAKEEARRAARKEGARFVEDSLDVETVEGAGTMGLEWLGFPEKLDDLLVPLGNGAVFNGVALALSRSVSALIGSVDGGNAECETESSSE